VEPLVPRETFDALRDGVYLNQASLGVVPRTSTEAMVRFQVDVAQHGNVRMSDAQETAVLDTLRASAADFLDAPRGSVAVVGGASEALGQLTSILAARPGDAVLVRSDFPSVTYPWLGARERVGTGIRWVDDDPAQDLTTGLVAALDDGVGAVCFGSVQYATGTEVDVARVVGRAHAVGAIVVVDVTQQAGVAPVSMRDWSADALVCSGYKWLSGHGGVALLAVGSSLVGETPHVIGWKGTDDPFDFRADRLSLAPDARRFELSTMAYGSAVSLATSLDLLAGLGMPAVAAHAAALARELASRVEPLGWTPFRPLGDRAASSHIVSLRHPVLRATEVQRSLVDRGVVVGARGGAVRVSLHHYNGSADVDALCAGLAEVGRGG
jgi:selenocysteine lyase/cysteine desulfurase